MPPPHAPALDDLPPIADPKVRPAVEGFNIFDVSSMGPGLSSHHPDFPPPASLLAEELFTRAELAGANCGTRQGPNTKERRFDTHRLAPVASLNIGCTAPGQSWLFCGGEDTKGLIGNLIAVFVADVVSNDEDASNQKEKWKAYGLYRAVFVGQAEKGEFSRWSEVKKSAVIDTFVTYWLGGKHMYDLMSGSAGRKVRSAGLRKTSRQPKPKKDTPEKKESVWEAFGWGFTSPSANDLAGSGNRVPFVRRSGRTWRPGGGNTFGMPAFSTLRTMRRSWW